MTTFAEDCPTVVHLERWREGDESAFELLHRRLDPLLRIRVRQHRVWPLLAQRVQLEDVLQEFWARSIHAVKEKFVHVGRGALLAYLGKIVDRQIIDLARRQLAQKRGDGEVQRLATNFDLPDRGSQVRAAPVTPTSHARHGELLRLAEQLLNPRELEAWRLVELEGYANEEAAVAMRVSESAVRGLLYRGSARLIARLPRDDRG